MDRKFGVCKVNEKVRRQYKNGTACFNHQKVQANIFSMKIKDPKSKIQCY